MTRHFRFMVILLAKLCKFISRTNILRIYHFYSNARIGYAKSVPQESLFQLGLRPNDLHYG